MQAQRTLKIARRILGMVWAMLVVFLVLSLPAHTAFASESGAVFAQLSGAIVIGSVYARRKRFARRFVRADEHSAAALRAAVSRHEADVPNAVAGSRAAPTARAIRWIRRGRANRLRAAGSVAAAAPVGTGRRVPASETLRPSPSSPQSTP